MFVIRKGAVVEAVAQYRNPHPAQLVQKGHTGRQVHLLLFVSGQPAI